MSGSPIFAGEVLRVRYANAENGFAVVALEPDGGGAEQFAVGTLSTLHPGDRVLLWGDAFLDPEYGERIRVARFEIALPASAAGVVRYFKRFRGIGDKYANALVEALGPDAINVALADSERVRAVLPPGPAEAVIKGLAHEASRASVNAALLSFGLNARQVDGALARWGYMAEDEVRSDPYQLTQIKGIGFVTADEVARRLGVAFDAPQRIRAAAAHVLEHAASEGHTYLPIATLDSLACRLLMQPLPRLLAELAEMEVDGRVVVDGEAVYLSGLFRVEELVATDLVRLVANEAEKPPVTVLPVRDGEWDVDQEAAIRAALSEKVSVITGAPGTGKSTCLSAVLDAAERADWEIALCAPTGRAAKRMEEVTGRPASTIHRLLEFHPREGWRRNADNPLEEDLIVVDEASMVNLSLFSRLLDAIHAGARLLIVGDADQLPPIGAGAVLRDVIASGAVRVTRLTTVHRQASDSSILSNAHRINHGQMPLRPDANAVRQEGGDYFFIQRKPATTVEMVVRMACERIPERYGLDPRRDVWVLAPMKDGPCGVHALNEAMREALNPANSDADPRKLRVGDRVMQSRNNYQLGVFNGDVGFVVDVFSDDGQRVVLVHYEDRPPGTQVVTYVGSDVSELRLAWATTVHKAQGSESPAVILAIAAQQYVMLSRSLLYTAWTRARQLLVVVGEERALELAVDDAGRMNAERYSLLAERIRRVANTGVVPKRAARKKAGVE